MTPFSHKPDNTGTSADRIRQLIKKHRKTRLIAHSFFISWHGIPTIAYTGFSPVLLRIKKEISIALPNLEKENPGSLWPKTTLGALYNNISLSLRELEVLKTICDQMEPLVQGQIIEVDTLCLVRFHCRSLEQRLFTEKIPLSDPRDTTGPPEHHKEYVAGIINQFSGSQLKEYLDYVRKKGHRESYYREHQNETTLIIDLISCPAIITAFKEKVDNALPQTYTWFSPESLHITIRALV